jgi:hypothetical protein
MRESCSVRGERKEAHVENTKTRTINININIFSVKRLVSRFPAGHRRPASSRGGKHEMGRHGSRVARNVDMECPIPLLWDGTRPYWEQWHRCE